jgi:hypothetical protein
MSKRITQFLVVAFAALVACDARGRDVFARCYLDSRWHIESRAAWHADMVRKLADARRTVTSHDELAQLRAILRLDRFRPRHPWPDDFCFVADIRRSDGTTESYYGGRFFVMSADFRRGLQINRTAFRRDIDRFMGVRR